ncbi:hypothetical protein [Priestia megaterium]|uniref:Uncharacterized protein n=2 Tax=Bacteria TaxID=2 RepID=A0A5B8R2L7_9GAMM|nr:hypothetical protein [Priestia megaterium]QDZ82729.1 hypothetical protein D0440_26035 [Priestia megaterium]
MENTFYLTPTHSNRRLTYEVYSNWDYVKLASEGQNGTSITFEPDPSGDGYFLKMNASNYADHVYFTTDSKGWVYLDKKEKASRYYVDRFAVKNEAAATPIQDIAGVRTNNMFFKLLERQGKLWLSTDGYKDPQTGDIDRNIMEFIRA